MYFFDTRKIIALSTYFVDIFDKRSYYFQQLLEANGKVRERKSTTLESY